MKSGAARDQVVVYRPNQRHELGWLQTWAVMAGNVARSRQLIWQLFKRDFLAQYKKSFIGVVWIFLTPLAGIIHWMFLYLTGILNPGETDVPFPLYVLVGSSMWGLFMGFRVAANATLSAGASFIMQVNYPHEALLFKQVGQQVAQFCLAFMTTLVAILVFDAGSPTWSWSPGWAILLFPLAVLPLFFLGTALGLMLSMVSIVAVDLSRLVNMALAMLMYATPVIYGDKLPNRAVQAVIKWNPLTYLVCSARDMILEGKLYHPPAFWLCAGGALVLFMISWRLFYVSEHKIVERMI